MSVLASHPRRLSSRRGSTSAPDPYARFSDINEAQDRTSSSKLTIVRVLPPQHASSPPPTPNDANIPRRRSWNHRFSGGATSPPPDGSSGADNTRRLSFAFSNFGSGEQGPPGHRRDSSTGSVGYAPSSPSGSPRIRPIGSNNSPRLSATRDLVGKPRLTPDQIVDLARQATNPRTLAQIAAAAHSTSGSASPNRPASPLLRSQSPALGAQGQVAPATFTPLPDDIYLPFIDRPHEVAQLISTPPDVKLFGLLSQTLPKTYDGPLSDGIPPDPARWTFAHLHTHLTKVDRDAEPDVVWVAKARRSILSHSELIWERVKGCFGVPPELDHVDWDWEKEERVRASLAALAQGQKHVRSDSAERMRRLRAEIRQGAPKPTMKGGRLVQAGDSAFDDDSDDEIDDVPPPGAGIRKTANPPAPINMASVRASDEHWADWDQVVDSPIHMVPARTDSVDTNTTNVGISIQSPSFNAIEDDHDDFIEIEALVAAPSDALPSSPPGPNAPPLSLGGSMLLTNPELAEGNPLGDIAEGEEDEDEGNASKERPEAVAPPDDAVEEDTIPPEQIQGLRISTAPVHASGAYGVGGVYVAHHQHPHGSDGGHSEPMTIPGAEPSAITASDTVTGILSRTQSRKSSFSSVTGVSIGPFSRSESTGNLASMIAQVSSPNAYAGSDAGDSAGYVSDMGSTRGARDSLGDRLPGHPLFVSNFARLNGIPTLQHSPHSPPPLSGGGSSSGSYSSVSSPPSAIFMGGSHSNKKSRAKRTNSTSGSSIGSVPSSSFIGNLGSANSAKSPPVGGGLIFGNMELGRVRTNSGGSLRSGR